MISFTSDMLQIDPYLVAGLEQLELSTVCGKQDFNEFRILNNTESDLTLMVVSDDPKLSFRKKKIGDFSVGLMVEVPGNRISSTIFVKLDGPDSINTDVDNTVNIQFWSMDTIIGRLPVHYRISSDYSYLTNEPESTRYDSVETDNIRTSFLADAQLTTIKMYKPLPVLRFECLPNVHTPAQFFNTTVDAWTGRNNRSVGYESPVIYKVRCFLSARVPTQRTRIDYRIMEHLESTDDMQILIEPDFRDSTIFDNVTSGKLYPDYELFSDDIDGVSNSVYKRNVYTCQYGGKEYAIENIRKVFGLKLEFLFYVGDMIPVVYPSASNQQSSYLPWSVLYDRDGNQKHIVTSWSDETIDEYNPYIGDSSS